MLSLDIGLKSFGYKKMIHERNNLGRKGTKYKRQRGCIYSQTIITNSNKQKIALSNYR